MINVVSPFTPVNVTGDGPSETVNVEQKLGIDEVSKKEKLYLDGLYASLKKIFKSSADVKASEIVQYVGKFVAADGTSPYQDISTQPVVADKIIEMSDTEKANEKLYLDGLYASLQKLFKSSPGVKTDEIIQHVAKFVAADGTSPYKSIRTHTVTIAKIMEMFKADGKEGEDFYKTLNQCVGYSVVSNGMLDKFIGDMLLRSEEEEPEAW
ncbi:hypothetical protein FHW67_000793 [Herbaspirillum sp. Sphag1AN]|uniref:hypothetical protein n=1 Tax=unclassified Herbaspirillum TaxID=2624150 RepID=UPI00160E8B30|nr:MULTISPECIES: hypothetical protein [unclassified Herbaspirillum]MBB3211545.1 hypothetical protein [Herbaspirillum sp. Sphag1AN]MBB3245188.1 hypothetical protein [Herbaspirillum sp. Sphag64]